MFDSLMDSSPKKKGSKLRDLYTSTVSVVVHGVLLLSMITASYLHVEALPEPAINVQFVGQLHMFFFSLTVTSSPNLTHFVENSAI